MNYDLLIGKIKIRINSMFELEWDETMSQFLYSFNSNPDIIYNFKIVDYFEPIYGNIVFKSDDCIIINSNNTEYRIYQMPNHLEPYAYSTQINNHEFDVYFSKNVVHLLKGNRLIFNFITLDHILLEFQSIVLHASYIVYNNKAILFSAPSGTGKSTQADLWHKTLNADIINGDRTLLSYENGCFYACGYPISGSSNICKNFKHPIQAIVFLDKGKTNIIQKMNPILKYKLLYEQLFINNWNQDSMNKSFDLINLMIEHLQIIHYTCTKETNAVTDLLKYLEKE